MKNTKDESKPILIEEGDYVKIEDAQLDTSDSFYSGGGDDPEDGTC